MIKDDNFHDVDIENIKKLESKYKEKKTAHCNLYLKPIDLSADKQTIVSGFNQLIHRIRTKLNVEVLIRQTDQINDAIEQRCKNFADNKKTMLNSLLEREKRNHHKYTKRVIVGILNNDTWNITNNEIEIQHYKNIKQENWNLIVEKCNNTNCLFGKLVNGNCIVSVNKSTTLLLDKKPNKKGDQWLIKQPYFSLLIDLENLERKPTEIDLVSIDVTPYNERSIFISNFLKASDEIQNRLKNIAELLDSQNRRKWVAYTDGSLQRFNVNNDTHTSQGFGWHILTEDTSAILTEFNAASKAWPSSTRMELLAVLTLVSILPRNSEITIRTDSNNVITKFEKFKGNIVFRRKIKENNLVFWEVLFEIIKRFNINIVFQKVKAHSGDKYNDRADTLAKLGCNMDRIDIEDNILTERARLFWFDHCIDKI